MGPEQAVHAGSQQAVDLPWLLRIPPQADDAEAVEQRHEAGTPVALVEAHGVDARSSQVGGPPLLMEPVEAKLTFKGSRPIKVRPLDVYGVPRKKSIEVAADGSFVIDGTQQTFYYEVKR